MLISPHSYRTFTKPRRAELFKAQRELFPQPLYVFSHSDGAIYDIIPDSIELGIDVLNPVHASAGET